MCSKNNKIGFDFNITVMIAIKLQDYLLSLAFLALQKVVMNYIQRREKLFNLTRTYSYIKSDNTV